MGERFKQPCETCLKGAGGHGGCNWSTYLQPVNGWKAIPTKVQTTTGHYQDSFKIIFCPEYEAEPPRDENRCMLTEAQDDEFKKDPFEFLKRYEHYTYFPRRRRGGGVNLTHAFQKRDGSARPSLFCFSHVFFGWKSL